MMGGHTFVESLQHGWDDHAELGEQFLGCGRHLGRFSHCFVGEGLRSEKGGGAIDDEEMMCEPRLLDWVVGGEKRGTERYVKECHSQYKKPSSGTTT